MRHVRQLVCCHADTKGSPKMITERRWTHFFTDPLSTNTSSHAHWKKRSGGMGHETSYVHDQPSEIGLLFWARIVSLMRSNSLRDVQVHDCSEFTACACCMFAQSALVPSSDPLPSICFGLLLRTFNLGPSHHHSVCLRCKPCHPSHSAERGVRHVFLRFDTSGTQRLVSASAMCGTLKPGVHTEQFACKRTSLLRELGSCDFNHGDHVSHQ